MTTLQNMRRIIFRHKSPLLTGNTYRLPRHWGVRFFVLCLLSAVFVQPLEARSVTQGNFPGILRLHQGKLTAKLNGVSLRQVMGEIGALSGAEILWLQENAGGIVSANFSDVPFMRAIRLLLGEKNFLLFYSSAEEGAQLSQIWISNGVSTPTTVAAPPPVNATRLHRWYRIALHGSSPPRRLQAVQQLQQHAPTNAHAKRLLTALARSATDPRVRQAATAAVSTMQARN